MELIKTQIYSSAIQLLNKKYNELRATNKLSECDAIVVNHKYQTFWFTTQKTGMYTVNNF